MTPPTAKDVFQDAINLRCAHVRKRLNRKIGSQ